MFSPAPGPIGIFDSGYGGLTIFDKIREAMPGYDYVYLGDNARSPYGPRSFEVVYRFTRQAVETLFNEGCQLVILAWQHRFGKGIAYDPAAGLAAVGPGTPGVGRNPSDGGVDG